MSDKSRGLVRVHWLAVNYASNAPIRAACGRAFYSYQLTQDEAKVTCRTCLKILERRNAT